MLRVVISPTKCRCFQEWYYSKTGWHVLNSKFTEFGSYLAWTPGGLVLELLVCNDELYQLGTSTSTILKWTRKLQLRWIHISKIVVWLRETMRKSHVPMRLTDPITWPYDKIWSNVVPWGTKRNSARLTHRSTNINLLITYIRYT